MKKYILLFFVIFVSSLKAQTNIFADTLNGVTWDKAHSPYVIQGDMVIVDLIIEPGVEVLFQDNYTFQIDSLLIAKGVYSDSIVFKPLQGNAMGWEGLNFNISAANSEISYCNISGTINQAIFINQSKPKISNSRIYNNLNNGISVSNDTVQIINSSIDHNNMSGFSLSQAHLTLINTIVANNSEAGIFSIASQDSVTLLNSVIADNAGTGVLAFSGKVVIKNSIIYDNGIQISTIPGNTIVNYSDVKGGYAGTNNINLNPDFINRKNYTLSDNSPCIDSGDPDFSDNDLYLPPSLGSNRNDMGAYGGPNAGNWYPPLLIKPDSLDFGNVSSDSSKTLNFILKNYRDADITVSDILLQGANPAIFSTFQNFFTIPVLDSFLLSVTFSPAQQDIYSASILFKTDNHGSISAHLFGEGIAPEINLLKNSLNFNQVFLGDSATLDLPILNSGSDSLRIFDVLTTNSSFTVAQTQLIINPGPGLDTLYIAFKPDTPVVFQDSLIIYCNDPDENRIAISIRGEGRGPVLGLEKSNIDFGSVPVNSDSSQNLLIFNPGNELLQIENIPIISDDSVSCAFSFADSTLIFPLFIEPDSSFNLFIKFSPFKMGLDSAKLQIQSNDPFRQNKLLDLKGIGLASDLVISNSIIDFGTIPFNSHLSKKLHIYNFGNGDLIVYYDSLLISGSDAGSFFIDSLSSDLIVTPGDSAALQISFYSTEIGSKEAVLKISSNDPIQPNEFIDLRGNSLVPDLTISQSNLDFGDTQIYSDSTLILILKNTGDGELLVYKDSLSFSGSDSSLFYIDTLSADLNIAPNDSSELEIHFNALLPGFKQAELKISSNDPDQPVIFIALSGNVLAPISFYPQTSLNFGKIYENEQTQQSLDVHNSGDGNLIIYYDSLSFTGLNASEFIIVNINQNLVILPQDSGTVTLEFKPMSAGIKQAALNITTNDPFSNQQTISLTGEALSVPTPNVTFDETNSSSEFISNQVATLSFQISNSSFVDSVNLNLRLGGKITFTSLPFSHQSSSDLWAVQIDSNWLTSRGLEYFVRVYFANNYIDWPEEGEINPKVINIELPNVKFPFFTKQKIYQKISIPFSTNGQSLFQLFGNELGDYNTLNYRIYDCVNGIDYVEINDMDIPLPPGKSLWLITKDSVMLDVSNGTSVSSEQDYSLQLQSGWNMIATPFAFPVSWAEIDSVNALRFYDGSDWLFDSILEPYKGYAVHVETAKTISIPAKEISAKLSKSATLNKNLDWSVKISVEAGNYKDEFNYAGAHEFAVLFADHFDHREPPVIGNYVSLYFLQKKADNETLKNYSTDIRNSAEHEHIFDIELNSNINLLKTIKIQAEHLPENYDWIVIVPGTKIKYSENQFRTESNFAKYQLIVGTKQFVEEAASQYFNLPEKFVLHQNFPNPFNPQTVIEYQIPRKTKVSIYIYDILGRHVKTVLKNTIKDAGYYQIEWDGSDDTGRKVTSGIYLLHLKSDYFNKSIKMILQK